MLMLATLLLCALFINQSTSSSLTYILKKQANRVQPSCIAEEGERYAAVGWVYPMPNTTQQIPKITTKFIPTIQNAYNCKFSNDNVCNTRWALKNWDIDKTSAKTMDFLGDDRWEALPTILVSENTTEFSERFDVPTSPLRLTFSVRASDFVEILLCNGWDPYKYQCYYIRINKMDIFLQKYANLPKNISRLNALDTYRAFSNILSDDEWRNFIINLDENGTLSLIDVNLNRSVIVFNDKEPLKPIYFHMRSKEVSLWKIHQNNFMYTKSAQISRLGPQLNLNSRDLCISLYVATCSQCEMTFFHQIKSERKILKHIFPTKNVWINIKLKEENVQLDKFNLFVDTKYLNESNGQTEEMFWGIDDVRLCHENEVKVTYLHLNKQTKNKSISCQLISKPNWRPKKLEFNEIKDFPEITGTANDTSIKLTWSQEDPQNRINYFISYQANDLCDREPFNMRRQKSNGFLMTKFNEISIDNLVPYTRYNITVSSVLHEKDKEFMFSTLETDTPTFEETANNAQMQATSDSSISISWDKPSCQNIYGHLFATIVISNKKLNFTRRLEDQTGTDHIIKNLQPFTKYNITIGYSRKLKSNFDENAMNNVVYPITTLAGVAGSVENLEVYSVDENSASLRFDLPKNLQGLPTSVQINRCNQLSFSKCKASISALQKCKLFRDKYCAEVNYLIPHQMYTFAVSLKNDRTHRFGEEKEIEAYIIDRVPNNPTNITYKFVECQESVDYCHLNVSWRHPYYQNGTITNFHLILNKTDQFDGLEEDKMIQEIYPVQNKSYLQIYTYQMKYIPYSTNYNLFIQSSNTKYRSKFEQIHVKTGNIGLHIDQSPKLLGKADNSALFKLPHLDHRLSQYKLLSIVQDYNVTKKLDTKQLQSKKIVDNLCHNFGTTWLAQNLTISDNETKTVRLDALRANTSYCVTFVITNKYKNSEHDVVYYEKFRTPAEQVVKDASASQSNSHLWALILLPVLVILVLGIVWYVRKRRAAHKTAVMEENVENEYETLPFEECDDNFANNLTYDKLLHQ